MDMAHRIYGQDPDKDKRPRTVIPTTRQKNDFIYRAIDILSIACFICFLFIYGFEYVKHRFRINYLFHMYINLNSLQNIVFNFNTRSHVFEISFTHVKFYLGRAFEIFDIPVTVKLFCTQLGFIDNSLIIYYTITYWLINIYLPVTFFRFTCFDKIPEFISIDFTPRYITVLENWQLCNSVLVFDLFDLLYVYTSIIDGLTLSKMKYTCSALALLCLLFSAIYILTHNES